MSSTRERDAFPKTLCRLTWLMLSPTEALISQWESSVFVSPIKAPALMILDEYGAKDRIRRSLPGCSWSSMLDSRNIVIIRGVCLWLLTFPLRLNVPRPLHVWEIGRASCRERL